MRSVFAELRLAFHVVDDPQRAPRALPRPQPADPPDPAGRRPGRRGAAARGLSRRLARRSRRGVRAPGGRRGRGHRMTRRLPCGPAAGVASRPPRRVCPCGSDARGRPRGPVSRGWPRGRVLWGRTRGASDDVGPWACGGRVGRSAVRVRAGAAAVGPGVRWGREGAAGGRPRRAPGLRQSRRRGWRWLAGPGPGSRRRA